MKSVFDQNKNSDKPLTFNDFRKKSTNLTYKQFQSSFNISDAISKSRGS
jgi:hypothetical protein